MATTPADILRISEPVEAIYERTVDELLINIARHFTISGWERTRYWEIKKLSEMGALTEESARIIAQNTGKLPEEIEAAFLQVSEKACLDIDPQLRGAASKGLLQDPGTDATTSPLIRSTVQAYVDEAVDKANMVNTTLLQSTRQAYLQGVTTAVAEAQLLEAQAILDTQTLAVSIGMETRTRAIRKAMEQMSAAGLTGFVDRSGRNWSPEAYAAMVVRTASHNVYVRSIKDRQAEFGGGDIFQVSSHPGARPLCYPYQGKFYSWSAGPGEFTDGGGIRRPYDNINNTSYGQPAGLFGINCGHHPIPMIPGYSYPQEYEEQSKEENDREYEESQIQRQYERNIRIAKRDREIAAATGDKEAEKKAAQKVQQEQAKMRGFIKESGRVRRYDREQIGMGDVAPKLVKPAKQTTLVHKSAVNKYGKEIEFDFKGKAEKHRAQQELLVELSSEYNTRLEKVTLGAHHAAGDVDIMGQTMKLSTTAASDAAHEFLHSMANTDADKYGLTSDQAFWSDMRQLRTEYRKAVRKNPEKRISLYADTDQILDEFAAEGFTQGIAARKGLDLPDKYGRDTEYAGKVLALVDKYFKKGGK